jgi:hypothetical protein
LRHLAALEDERFDELPEEVCVKGFLRAYADYLGLDGELFVAEFKSRPEANRPLLAPEPEPRFTLPPFFRAPLCSARPARLPWPAGVLAWRYARRV